ncbi:uncharacterized protein TNCV_16681 [Trichonephila clavipes]|nr:uncharacterized protein TNCV_16681 [Trichonephila clavipes]
MIVSIYLSIARAWLLYHLTPSFPVPTDDAISRVFNQSSALEQVVAILAWPQSGQASLAAMPSHWRYTPKKSCPIGESGQQPRLSPGVSGLGPQWPEFPMAIQNSSFFGSWQYICQCVWR